ncbi:LOW QUALITY PROTEIN: hypothetical protein U9M48_044275 [Paspalum notatum var. saurae]|uniref:Uncharacterized protein n=1 Tax=Paspalum notatum var. saurae TaxID=547442 RepID=A0AAQ3XI32_PASNO
MPSRRTRRDPWNRSCRGVRHEQRRVRTVQRKFLFARRRRRRCTCSGGDADEPRHHALHGADDGGLAEEDDVEAGPGEEAGGGGDVGVEHGHGRRDAGGVGRAAVEARPAHPQQPAAGDHQQDVVRGEALAEVGEAVGTYPVGGGESGDAGGEVDDVTAGVVDDAPVVEEAAAPEAEGADGVGEEEPERGEGHPGLDVHAAQDGARQEHQRDGGELELEQHQRGLRVHRLRAGRGGAVRGGRQRRARHEPWESATPALPQKGSSRSPNAMRNPTSTHTSSDDA